MPTPVSSRLQRRLLGGAFLSLVMACGPRPAPRDASTPTLDEAATAANPTPETPVETQAEPEPQPAPDASALANWRERFASPVQLDPALQDARWFYAARLLANRTLFPAFFREADFELERGSLLLVTQISEGVGQPRYHYFSLEDTGWAPAPKHFVPASTVKLMASVAALWTLSKSGLDGDTPLAFTDIDGPFRGSAYKLYKDALLHSSNQNYNRLMAIAGFDATNTEYLTPERGFPVMAIQSRYGKSHRSYGIRVSPTITYNKGREDEGSFPRRKGEWRTGACRGNCTTLFELQDVMRRVMLHDELPEEHRFPLARVDLERIQGLLLQARNRLQPSPNRAFGEDVWVYNSVGRIPGRVLLENSYLFAPGSHRRIMLALSLRFPKERDPKKKLQALARVALDAALDAPAEGPGLQHDAGVELRLELAQAQDRLGALISTESGAVDEIELWDVNTRVNGAQELETQGRHWLAGELPLDGRETLLVAIARKDGKEVGYRSWRLIVPSPAPAERQGNEAAK